MKPFDQIWTKTKFRNQEGYILKPDVNTCLFMYQHKHGFTGRVDRWDCELMFGPGRKIIETFHIVDMNDTDIDEISKRFIQDALEVLHKKAVAYSYAATNLRVATGVPDKSLES